MDTYIPYSYNYDVWGMVRAHDTLVSQPGLANEQPIFHSHSTTDYAALCQ